MDEIRTFDHARAVLQQQDHTVEKSMEPKLWVLDHRQTLDTGGIIAAARALAGQATMLPARATPATPLPLARIRTDGGTQARASLDETTVAEYAAVMQEYGIAHFDAIDVVYDGTDYWLADGFHRVQAARRVDTTGQGTIPATIRPGTRRDAVLHACGANARHGLRRSAADKRRAIETLLRDGDWGRWSDREIARHCAVDHKTVAAVRRDLVGTGEIPQSSIRQTGDGRTMQVTAIAAANATRIDPLHSAATQRTHAPPDEPGPPASGDQVGSARLAQPPVPEVGTTPAAPGRTRRDTDRWMETDLDAALLDRLRAAGWTWQQAKWAPNGWHHVVRHHSGAQRLLLRQRLGALCPLEVASAPATAPSGAPDIAGRHQPIVPTVLYFADQTHPYRLPAPQRLAVAYGMPMTVRLADPGAQLGQAFYRKTLMHTHVWCIPDDPAWTRLTTAHTALQQALEGLAAALRRRGRYDQRLEATGGITGVLNPLTPTVIGASDPDAPDGYARALGEVPRINRYPARRHTPKMVEIEYRQFGDSWARSAQHQFFVCPTDDDWMEIQHAQQAVQAARATFEQVLGALGRYSDARADGRYAAARAAATGAQPVEEPNVDGDADSMASRWAPLVATEALLATALATVRSGLGQAPAETRQLLRLRVQLDTIPKAAQQLLESPHVQALVTAVLHAGTPAPPDQPTP